MTVGRAVVGQHPNAVEIQLVGAEQRLRAIDQRQLTFVAELLILDVAYEADRDPDREHASCCSGMERIGRKPVDRLDRPQRQERLGHDENIRPWLVVREDQDSDQERENQGDAPGLADCCLVPQIFNAKRYECDLAPYPSTMRVFDACMQLEAFDRAQPAKQPDAE